MTTKPPPSAAPGYAVKTAVFWARTQTARRLRRKGFKAGFAIFGVVLPLLQMAFPAQVDLSASFVVLGLVPLVSLLAGGGALRDEIDDQTLTYSFIRPIGRAWVFRALVTSAMAPVVLITLPCVIVTTYPDGFNAMGAHVLAALLAIASYTTVFALAGQFTKRATALGCVYLFFWEAMVSSVPGFLGKLTLVTHVRAVAGIPTDTLPLPLDMFAPATPVSSALVLVAVAAIAMFLGGVFIQRREHAASAE